MKRVVVIGRSTVREAVKGLVTRGVLEVRRGDGTYVISTSYMENDVLGFGNVEDRYRLALDLFDVRLMIEPEIVTWACRKATEEQIRKLKQICEEVEHLYKQGIDHIYKDIEFHSYLARLSDNIVDKLSGGFLAIGHASAMSAETVENLSKAMEFKTNRLTVILEDSKAGIYTLKQDYPEFMEKFDSRIVIPVFTNDELVSFAKTYAKEKGYKVDDIAVLAVYSLIGDNQYEDDPVCVGQVREMMDSAIAKASRLGRRPGKKVAKRHLDVTGRIMLYEKDFNL